MSIFYDRFGIPIQAHIDHQLRSATSTEKRETTPDLEDQEPESLIDGCAVESPHASPDRP
ncbi:hypothetical protein RAS12_07065 [Achromobacter seleniivolatilans]|uniref:Uncharacterized protein n=1 Tax=Achromobacter seleniivolatilans TaxID=3047478 RepID=A0ABY9M6C2_9BURK|nr:hypothetical protein [Achromobacter sp. R39]WMD22129.1 hypothetical protein RAS12_07065 [Achromobacter sp. R39]